MTLILDVVTGATQGIGRSIAEYIAHQRAAQLRQLQSRQQPYVLALVGRDKGRGAVAAKWIAQDSGLEESNVVFASCDIGNWDDVLGMKQNFMELSGDVRVGVLVNCAAECPRRQQRAQVKQRADDGSIKTVTIDRQFATNVLGYHFMVRAFQDIFSSNLPLPVEGSKTHILNVASNWAGDLDLDDLHFTRRRYDNDSAYRQSKQCNRMMTKVWSKELCDVAVVNACHPGDPCTTLSTALGYNLGCAGPTRRMVETQSPIPYLCGLETDKQTPTTGGWFEGRSGSARRCSFGSMDKDAEQLVRICDNFCWE